MNFADLIAEKGLPHNVEAERAVLGACLLVDVFGQLSWLSPDHFHVAAHRKIYAAMVRLWGEGQPVDYLTLGDALERAGALEDIGGHTYLTGLTEGLPAGLNVEHYAGIVVEKAKARRIIALASEAVNGAVAGLPVSEVSQSLSAGTEAVAAVGKRGMATGPLLLPAHKFIAQAPERIDWLVEGLIERGAVGFIAADPKVGKSWLAIDLAAALAVGDTWLGFRVVRPSRVALISREDSQRLTAWRLRRLLAGRGLAADEYAGEIWCNSRNQSPEFWLTDRQHVCEMTDELKPHAPDMVILDVFNKMYQAKENDQYEMAPVVRAVEKLSADLDAALCVVHHTNKGDDPSIVRRLRGSSAIGGAAQWIVGAARKANSENVRYAEFVSKADEDPAPRHFRIVSDADWSRIELVDYARDERPAAAGRSAAAVVGGGRLWNRN